MRAALEDASDATIAYESANAPARADFDVRKYVFILRRRWLSLLLPTAIIFASCPGGHALFAARL